MGDFNAHNPIWGGVLVDERGKIIEDIIDINNLFLFNDGSKTYQNIHAGYSSAIDLSICSSNVYLDFHWSVNEFLNGSDHYPIHLKTILNMPASAAPKWKAEEADWQEYKKNIKINEFDTFGNHIDAYNHLEEAMLSSAQKSIPKTKGMARRPCVPWWNNTCAELRKRTRRCYKR